jgi:sugar phosphate isomerase/epimerase
MYTRREFGRLALAGLPAAALVGRGESIFGALAQAKPNSLLNGVQLGVITYSYRSMQDQSAEATLKYVVESGINAIELMGGPVESFAGAPAEPQRPQAAEAGRGGTARGSEGAGRGSQSAAPIQGQPSATATASWKGRPCEPVRPGAPSPAGRGGRRGRGQTSPEQQAAQQEYAKKLREWRTSVSMEPFKQLRQMYNDAGVTIYAWKQLRPNMSDEEAEYVFNVAEALGCTHTTVELPTDRAQLKRFGDFATKHKVHVAYHTHLQGNMTAFDQAFVVSPGNMANVDFGHWVAAGNVGGAPMDFLRKHHDRIASFHLKDRTTPEHCALNLPFGEGETPIKEILQLLSTNRWKIPATIELEYEIPEGSDAVKEVRRCLEYCRRVLTS